MGTAGEQDPLAHDPLAHDPLAHDPLAHDPFAYRAESAPGPLADEAVRLLGAAQSWLRGASVDAARTVSSGECRWCPMCQAVASLHIDGPDLSAKLTAMLTSVTELVVNAFADRPDPGPPAGAT